MGVSGCGKSTVGALLAEALNLRFVDADDLHSETNKTKMACGIPLDDADRKPWLDSVGAQLQKGSVVIACSALRRRYRERLRQSAPWFRLIYLYGTPELLAHRLNARVHKFMPSMLLSSQLATLEPPDTDEGAIALNVESAPNILVAYAIRRICSIE